MMVRIRICGYSVGQVDDVLVEEFRKVRPFRKLVNIANVIISEEILKHNITSIDDVKQAEAYVQNLHYRNLGEYLTDYMRNACIDNFQICRNCADKCSMMRNPLQAGCDRFSTLPHIPGM